MSITIAFSLTFFPPTNLYYMEHDFKKLKTGVIQTMIIAHSSYYGRVLTPDEEVDCNITISQLQLELAIRKIKESQLQLPN